MKRLKKLQTQKDQNKEFNFDILMANPPFAGDIKESRILYQYELGFNSKSKVKGKVGRDILFIERNLNFLKPGGRMAIVLPQGRFSNTSDKDIREFIAQHGRILAVIGLHGNTFKPHTGTKTSVLFMQKWGDKKEGQRDLCPKLDDYPIFFAVSENGGKNNSGDYIYVKNENGEYKLDRNGHLIVDHDLHSNDGELSNGIAEAFIEWAKGEKLSFWMEDLRMRFSVLNKSECAKYDFGYFLLTPDFFSEDALINWDILDKKSSKCVSDYFSHIKDTVDEIKEVAICYDLTDALPNFFDKDVTIAEIGSTKKVAKEEDFVISKLRSYLEEMGIVEQKRFPQLFSTEFLVLRKRTEELSTYTLFALCMTKIVQTIFKRGQHGTEHPKIL